MKRVLILMAVALAGLWAAVMMVGSQPVRADVGDTFDSFWTPDETVDPYWEAYVEPYWETYVEPYWETYVEPYLPGGGTSGTSGSSGSSGSDGSSGGSSSGTSGASTT
jgi:uncharacterized membrane protein YgcG